METRIKWRDAKSEEPQKSYVSYTCRDSHGRVFGAHYANGRWSSDGGSFTLKDIAHFAIPSDIQTGTFVEVEEVRGLGRWSTGDESLIRDKDGAWVRLSDVGALAGRKE